MFVVLGDQKGDCFKTVGQCLDRLHPSKGSPRNDKDDLRSKQQIVHKFKLAMTTCGPPSPRLALESFGCSVGLSSMLRKRLASKAFDSSLTDKAASSVLGGDDAVTPTPSIVCSPPPFACTALMKTVQGLLVWSKKIQPRLTRFGRGWHCGCWQDASILTRDVLVLPGLGFSIST